MDNEGGLVLTTEYETMSSIERFWFASPNVRLRTSTVKRFGGFSTASFCSETRVSQDTEEATPKKAQDISSTTEFASILGW
jgi:hypothetical protein